MFRDTLRQSTVMQQEPKATSTSDRDDTANDNFSYPRTNLVVQNLLLMDYEWTLLKYHGGSTYLQQKFQQFNISLPRLNFLIGGGDSEASSHNDTITTNEDPKEPNKTEKNKKVAKVAFMITRQQRSILQNDLNYTLNEIKSMKPIEALLLVENNIMSSATTTNITDVNGDYISGSSWKDICAKLVKENERLQSTQENNDEVVVEKVIEPRTRQSNNHTSTTNNTFSSKDETSTSISSSSTKSISALQILPNEANERSYSEIKNEKDSQLEETLSFSAIEEKSEDESHETTSMDNHDKFSNDDEDCESHDNNSWFEVLEHRVRHSTDEASSSKAIIISIALYQTREEAEECIDIKEEIHLKYIQGNLEKRDGGSDTGSGSKESTPEESVTYSIRQRKV